MTEPRPLTLDDLAAVVLPLAATVGRLAARIAELEARVEQAEAAAKITPPSDQEEP